MEDVQQQRRHFEGIADRYRHSRRHPNHLAVKDAMWRSFLRGKQFPDPLRALEPMCGYAEGKQILQRFAGDRILYTGFDYSDTLVNQARKEDPAANVFLQDVTTYDPRSERFDVIILIGGLHHVYRHADAVLERLGRALAPGGRFINLEPTQNNAIFRAVRNHIYRRNNLFDAETERAFDLDELNDLFQRNGFELEDQIYPGLLSYVLYYNPDAFPKLNVGSERLVRLLAGVDRLFFRNWVGRTFSFATLSMWRKP
jgi:SAM-dependent methyltransferase